MKSRDGAKDEFNTLVALSRIDDVSRVAALGFNVDIDIATLPEDMWPNGGVYPFLSTATSQELVSDSVNDAAAGTGARTVLVSGLDGNYAAISETVTLNGITAVPTANQYLRINQMRISSAGTGEINAGTINCRDTGGGTVRSVISAGAGISQQSIYTVRAGYTLVMHAIEIQINESAGGITRGIDVSTFFRSPTGFYIMPRKISCTDSQPYLLPLNTRIIVQEKNDFLLRCVYASTNNIKASGSWEGQLFKNT